MKRVIRRLVPAAVLDFVYRRRLAWRIRREFSRDAARYIQNVSYEDRVMQRGMSARAMETQVTKDYHRIEKGLSLSQPKRPFGAKVASRLDELASQLDPTSGLAEHVGSAQQALEAWNKHGIISDIVSPRAEVAPMLPPEQLRSFFASRHSVRDFDTSRTISSEVLEQATTYAMTSPSVCNRQAARVRFVTDPKLKDQLRRNQNGNAGFGEIPVLALITVDSRLFAGPGERNQAWVDGGLFAMTLAWALHGMGVASCMLNMSVTNERADRLRAALGVPSHELIIMQMALGYASEDHRVARSPRRMVSDVMTVVE